MCEGSPHFGRGVGETAKRDSDWRFDHLPSSPHPADIFLVRECGKTFGASKTKGLDTGWVGVTLRIPLRPPALTRIFVANACARRLAGDYEKETINVIQGFLLAFLWVMLEGSRKQWGFNLRACAFKAYTYLHTLHRYSE